MDFDQLEKPLNYVLTVVVIALLVIGYFIGKVF